MKTQCPHCNQRYEVDDEYNGQIIECQNCKQDFFIEPLQELPPKRKLESSQVVSKAISSNTRPALKQCPFCKAEIAGDAQKCCHCGEWVVVKVRNDQEITSKSEIIFVILGLLLGLIGVHNFYVNEKAAGFEKILLSILGISLLDWFPHSPLGAFILFVNAVWVLVEIIRNGKHVNRPEKKRSYGMVILNMITAILFVFFSCYYGYVESKYEEVSDISFRAGQAGALTIYNDNNVSLAEKERKINEERDKIFADALRTPLISSKRLIDLSSKSYKEGSDDVANTYRDKY